MLFEEIEKIIKDPLWFKSKKKMVEKTDFKLPSWDIKLKCEPTKPSKKMLDDLLKQAALEHELEQQRAWRKDAKFLAIKGVSKEDLRNGSAYIEKLAYPPWDKRNDVKGAPQVNQTNLVGFGKYATKEVSWVKENDPRYFEWMLCNVPKFAVKVRRLDLD